MTDKHIIIDGVDVSECNAMCTYNILGIEDKHCCYKFHEYCSAIPNCCFKQLKRKEQEYEELKSDLTDLSKIIDCKNGTILTFKEQLDQLIQTLAEIKEICRVNLTITTTNLLAKTILQKISEVEDEN